MMRWGVTLCAVVFTSGIACADELEASVNISKLCKSQDSPTYKEYWPAVSAAFPIPLPQSTFLPAPMVPNSKCDLSTVASSGDHGFATFNEAAKACGYATAVNIALIAGTSTYCPIFDSDQKQCEAIGGLRVHLTGRLKNLATENTPEAGTYRLRLGADYQDKTEPQRVALLLEDAGIWANGADVDPKRASIVCGPADPEPFKIPAPTIFAVAKDAEAVTRPLRQDDRDLRKVNAAELSLAFDRENRTVTERDENGEAVASEYDDFVSFNGAIGYNLNRHNILNRGDNDPNLINDSIIVAYIALEYAEAFDPTEETDNLSFGIRGTPQLGWNDEKLISNPVFDIAWVTDIEERESAQWAFSTSAGVYALDTPQWLAGYSPIDWTTNLVIDYLHVIDEGDKTSLAGVGETIRLGYDIKWELDWTPFDVGDFRPTLSGGFQYRDATEEGGPDADLVTVDLGLLPLKPNEAGIGLSIGYERGENLTSLEPLEAYKVKLTVKN